MNKVVIYSSNDLSALLSDKRKVFSEHEFHLFDNVDDVCWDGGFSFSLLFELNGPRVDDGLPAEVDGLEVDHAASGDCGRRGNGQVVYLEHHGEGCGKFYSLSIRKTEHLVVVEDGVHVLNPEGIDWPVKDNPLFGVRVVSHVRSNNGSHDAVSPLVCEEVDVAEELVHGD